MKELEKIKEACIILSRELSRMEELNIRCMIVTNWDKLGTDKFISVIPLKMISVSDFNNNLNEI